MRSCRLATRRERLVPSEIGRANEREQRKRSAADRVRSETALQSTAERALAPTRATGAAIALSEGSDAEMTCVASAGSDAPPVGSHVKSSSGFSGECVRTGRSLRCDDSESDDRVDREGCRALGIRSIVAVPIRSGTRIAGLVEVFSPNAYAFNAEDIATLQDLSGRILRAPCLRLRSGWKPKLFLQRQPYPRQRRALCQWRDVQRQSKGGPHPRLPRFRCHLKLRTAMGSSPQASSTCSGCFWWLQSALLFLRCCGWSRPGFPT